MSIETEHIPMTDGARYSLIVIAVLWVMFAIAVVLRLVGRIRMMGLGLDDILSVVALILSGSTIGINATIFTIGVGWDFDSDSAVYPKLVNNLPVILQFTFALTLVYIWSLTTLKMSQLTLYMRVFANQLRIWVYGIGAIVVIWALTFNFIAIFLCDPVSQQWTIEPIGHCMDQKVVLKYMIMTNSALDLLIVVLPMRSVWKLQMRKPEKLAVLICFGLGGACVIISLAGFIELFTVDLIGNFTGTALSVFMLGTVELMLAGLCINIPMLRPFYIRLRAKYKSSSGSGSREPSSHPASGLRQRSAAPTRPANYTAWIELADKDHTLVTSDDDASPSRKITSSQPNDDAIHVQTEWVISRA